MANGVAGMGVCFSCLWSLRFAVPHGGWGGGSVAAVLGVAGAVWRDRSRTHLLGL